MTIVEAVKEVLSASNSGLTSREVYQQIITRNLYSFPAKKPDAVVNSTIRRHCLGLDFPTANAVKHFRIVSYKGKKPCYGLIDAKGTPSLTADAPQITDQAEMLPEEKIQAAYKAHISTIEIELIRQIMNNHPSHLIEVIADKRYMLNALRRLNNTISIMTEIAGSTSPTCFFTDLFPCLPKNGKSVSMDSDEISVIHNIMRKMLRDSNLLPKALLMKYILSVIDKRSKNKKEYRKIYGVYLLSVLFVVFENKKSKDVLLSVLKAGNDDWYNEAITQIQSYFSTDRITNSRLLAQYKLGTNEDGEDYQFRCKSLATIYNFFEIRGTEVHISSFSKLKEFLTSEEKYSTEHFIISKSASRKMKVTIDDAVVDYEIEEKCYKSFVNSIFNFIFIPKRINSQIENNWLPKKKSILADKPEDIECGYSNMVISKAEILSDSFTELPLTTENYTEKLYIFFARSFRDKYVEYSREVLQAVIERIKRNV